MKKLFATAAPSLIPLASALDTRTDICDPTVVICKTTVFVYDTSALTLLGLVLYFGNYVSKLTWLKGKKTKGNCALYLRLVTKDRMEDMKVQKLTRHVALHTCTGQSETIVPSIEKHLLGDILLINWGNYKIFKYRILMPVSQYIQCPWHKKINS